MRAINLVLAASLAVPAFAQTVVIAQGSVFQKDFALYWQSRLEPSSPPLGNALGYGAGTNQKDGNIYRIMIDRAKHTYFGYEVRVEPLAQRGAFRMTFHQLDLRAEAFERLHMPDPSTWKKMETGMPAAKPLYPLRESPDTVHILDVVAVELLMNPETGQKIVDYVALQDPARTSWSFELPNQRQREFVYSPGNPRDFSIQDAGLTITEPRLRVNDKVEESTNSSRDDATGAIVWVYVQERGRYLLSLTARPGFHRSGEVRGTSLSFTWGDDRFTIGSAGRIALGDAPFNLYVREEAGWKPANAHPPRIMFGSADPNELR